LVWAALSDEEVVRMDFDPSATSLGGVLRNLLSELWPSQSPAVLKGWLADSPERLESAIQNARRLVR
jgi:hypothetical protein